MFASAQCSGTWSPSAMPSYVLSWEVSSDRLSVRFNVTVPTTGWAAVGFSTTASMVSYLNTLIMIIIYIYIYIVIVYINDQN